ncbi:MAG: ABC transporter substrate-binding protein [Deltaproteobacteria bacterium]|nr:ABC transporter substrate-binding protein [Deltaproteobacteria bacterium]
MQTQMKILLRLLLVAFLLLGGALPLRAGAPTEEIRTAIDQGVKILKNADLANSKQKAQVINQLREIVFPLFDFAEMAKRSLGSHWRRISPAQQKEFVTVFTELLETTYADKIDLYEGQQVDYIGETIDQGYAEVNTRVIGKNGQSYSVDYKLHTVGGKWRIYDVVAENISLVNNYRSQFNRVVVNSSFEELIKKIKQITK